MLDLYLPLASSREEDFFDPGPLVSVHDRDAAPISAHPNVVLPNSEAGARDVLGILRKRNLDLDHKKNNIFTSLVFIAYIP